MLKQLKKAVSEIQERKSNLLGLTNAELEKIGFSTVEEEKPIYTQSEVDSIRLRAKQDGFAAGLTVSIVERAAEWAIKKIVKRLQKAE